MSDEPQHRTERSPNDRLAAIIVEKLVDGGWLSPDRREEVTQKVMAGTATADDWRLWVELSGEKHNGSD